MNNQFDIETIVQEVVARLRGLGATMSVAPSSTVASATTSADANSLDFANRVVTLDSLRGKLADIRRLVVQRRAVVTPAVLDLLREKNIELVRSDADSNTNSNVTSNLSLAVTRCTPQYEQWLSQVRQYAEQLEPTSDLELARAFLKARLEKSDSVIFIAHFDKQPAGFTQLYPSFSSVSCLPIWILNDLFVREEFRRRTVGQALLAAARELGEGNGSKRLSLTTAYDNLPAQKLYEREGWNRDQEFYQYHLEFDV